MTTTTRYTFMDSPVGRLMLVCREGALTCIEFENGWHAGGATAGWVISDEPFEEPVRQLREYFAGHRREFELDLSPVGTPFQQSVWSALREIPYGQTRSYADIACRIGRPRAVRAVGAANGRNPLPIVIPCHRVVGQNGALTGFGGGLETKRRLLQLEGALPGSPLPLGR